MPKYYPINEEAARRAKNANSFSDYVPGSATAAYREMVDRAYTLGKQQKGRVDPMYHEKIDGLIDRYARKLAENINQSNLIDARVPSILIAGGSNFPVRKKEKQNAARDRNYGEYAEISKLLDKVRSTGRGGISADDDRAVEKLEAKLAGLEAMQEEMKTVNAYYRKHKTLEGCPVLSAEEIGKLQSSMASDWRKNPVPYPSYLLTNNNANIRRTRQRIEDLKSQSEYAGWAFPGGRAEINGTEKQRFQVGSQPGGMAETAYEKCHLCGGPDGVFTPGGWAEPLPAPALCPKNGKGYDTMKEVYLWTKIKANPF